MPCTNLPPTPASSTDIKGQDGSKELATSLQLSFELPPPAITRAKTVPSTAQAPYSMQASEAVKSRRRTSAAFPTLIAQQPSPAVAAANKDPFALPPPPTRSRRIIQMKPAGSETKDGSFAHVSGGTRAKAGVSGADSAAEATTKKKQSTVTSIVGRKMARKTAHSLIERRRRSKMNEEFAILKDMVPACSGEMHKLAILQASIEYIRYLEDCVAKLQQSGRSSTRSADSTAEMGPPEALHSTRHTRTDGESEDRSSDVEMTAQQSEAPSPNFVLIHDPASTISSRQPSVSPTLLLPSAAGAVATARQGRHDSYSSILSDYRAYSQYDGSATASPAFGAQSNQQQQQQHSVQHSFAPPGGGYCSASPSTLTSPALVPQDERDFDQEATAALLLLNQAGWRGPFSSTVSDVSPATTSTENDQSPRNVDIGGSGRGLSVRDLMST